MPRFPGAMPRAGLLRPLWGEMGVGLGRARFPGAMPRAGLLRPLWGEIGMELAAWLDSPGRCPGLDCCGPFGAKSEWNWRRGSIPRGDAPGWIVAAPLG